MSSPAGRRPAVVPVQRLPVVGVGVAEQRTEPRQIVLRGVDQAVEVVVPDLVAEMPQQGAVRLVHRDPQLLAVQSSPSARSNVMTPLWWPVTTFSNWLDIRSNASPYCGSASRLTIGSLRSMSSTTSRRLAFSAAANAANAAVSASLGRARVSLHDVHSSATAPLPGFTLTSQLHSAT